MNRGGYRAAADAEAEPVAVLQAAIQQLQQAGQQQQQQHHADEPEPPRRRAPPFLPAERFQGPRQGYYFGTGDEGTGYYRDAGQELEGEQDGGASRQQQDPEELLRQAEEAAEAAEVQLLDEKSLRKMLNAFEKKAKENLELRMKYADEPMKFLDNEVDLMSIIRGLAQVAADPNTLYPVLLDGPAVPGLAALLGHDNTDIRLEVLDLLQELTDADEEEDTGAVCGALVDALAGASGLELLGEALGRLDEGVDEEAGGVNNALAVVEHALELRPSLAEPLLARTKLLKWLLARVRVKGPCDSNKQYASEVLSILMQGHEANQALLGKANGVDTLLVCLAAFKSREPADALEAEFVENLFDTLCSCLLLPANRAAFVECEGVELMHLLLKGKKSSRYGAIKAIDFATTRSPAACDRLVEAGALAQLFAIFMGRSKIRNSKGEAGDADVVREVEERCVSIISNLFQGVTKNSRKERLAAKFVEAEFEKVDRLMEVVFRYEAAVSAVEARLADEAATLREEVDEEELALERLDAGLFTLQCGMVVAAALWATGDPGLRRRLLACLHQRGHSLEVVRAYLREYYFSLGDDGAPDEKQRQAQRLAQLLAGLGVDIAAEAAQRGQEQQQQQQQLLAAAADADGGAQQQLDADGKAGGGGGDPDGEGEEQPPLPPEEPPAQPDGQQQQPLGNGISSRQQEQQEQAQQQQEQQRGLSPPPDKQQLQRGAAASGGAAGGQQPSSGDRDRREDGGNRDRDRDRDGRRRRRSSRSRSRDRDRDRERDRHRSSRRRSRSRSRSRSPRDRKRSSGSSHKRRRHSPDASPA